MVRQVSTNSFQRYWGSENPAIPLGQRHTCPHTTKHGNYGSYLLLIIISMQKNKETNWFSPEILLIKQSCNIIRWPQLTTPNPNRWQVTGATFPLWLTPCKETKISTDSFQRYWWSKNPAIWLGKWHNWPHSTKSKSLRWYLHLMMNSMQKKLTHHMILSRDLGEQKILQSDWTKDKTGHT